MSGDAKFSVSEQVSLLLKKNLGKPSTDTSIPFYSEPSLDARPRVFTTQIFSSDIPKTRPATGWSGVSGTFPSGLAAESVSTHSDNVVRYYHKWPLVKVTNGNNMSFRAETDTTSTPSVENPLSGSIPFNYDSAGGYAVQLYRNTSGSVGNAIPDGTGEWVIDPDSGTLTFYHHEDVSGYVDENKPPFLSFFTYIGSTGLSAVSLWSEVPDGISYNDQTVLIGKSSRGNSTTSFDLEVAGQSKFDDTVTVKEIVCTSDRRLKKDIEMVKNPLCKLNQIQGVRFRWKSNNKVSYGVIADEIEKQLPGSSIINTKGTQNGFRSVNYNSAVALLIEAVKTQSKEIVQLKNRVSNLEKRYLKQ